MDLKCLKIKSISMTKRIIIILFILTAINAIFMSEYFCKI